MQVFFLAALGFALLGVMFALQNIVPVRVAFVAWTFEGSLALVLFVALIVGALVSSLVSIPTILKGRWAVKGLRKEIAELEAELADSRRSPAYNVRLGRCRASRVGARFARGSGRARQALEVTVISPRRRGADTPMVQGSMPTVLIADRDKHITNVAGMTARQRSTWPSHLPLLEETTCQDNPDRRRSFSRTVVRPFGSYSFTPHRSGQPAASILNRDDRGMTRALSTPLRRRSAILARHGEDGRC